MSITTTMDQDDLPKNPTTKSSSRTTPPNVVTERKRSKRESEPDPVGNWLFWILPLTLFCITLLVNVSMTSVERFNYVKSYPSRASFESLPNDLFELLDFVTPLSIKSIYHKLDQLNDPSKWELQKFIEWEEKIAWKRLIENIHPEGTEIGCVVASPSRKLPDYWYEWTRDSALVMKNLVQAFTQRGETRYRQLIDEYIEATRIIQSKRTTIGGFHDGGLGDVKYHVDHRPFTGEWGRPQNDGPALRIITLAEFAHHQLDKGTEEEKRFVRRVLYDSILPTKSIIKGDLEHISNRWSTPGFDLWEEVSGSHFYTLLAIHRALQVGARLADRLDDPKAAIYYRQETSTIENVLKEFWSQEKGLIRVSLNFTRGRESEENAHEGDDSYGKESELDAAILLAALHSGDGTEWSPNNPKVLATLDRLVDAMRPIYAINNQSSSASALGRYPEDRYDGIGLSVGHPWYLCTLAASEILYKASTDLLTSSDFLLIQPEAHSHYSRFLPLPAKTSSEIRIRPGSKEMKLIAKGQREWADQFVGIVQEFARRNGSLNEQFHRETGEGRGARDLTWSYAAFITAARARKEAIAAYKRTA